jgi:hypothetical protein
LYLSRWIDTDNAPERLFWGDFTAAQKKNRLGRSLHTSVPEHIYETLWQRLATRSTAEVHKEEVEHNTTTANANA